MRKEYFLKKGNVYPQEPIIDGLLISCTLRVMNRNVK